MVGRAICSVKLPRASMGATLGLTLVMADVIKVLFDGLGNAA